MIAWPASCLRLVGGSVCLLCHNHRSQPTPAVGRSGALPLVCTALKRTRAWIDARETRSEKFWAEDDNGIRQATRAPPSPQRRADSGRYSSPTATTYSFTRRGFRQADRLSPARGAGWRRPSVCERRGVSGAGEELSWPRSSSTKSRVERTGVIRQ